MEMFDTNARIAVLENELKNVASELKEMRVDQKEQHQLMMEKISDVDRRLMAIERWRVLLMGGSIVVAYILAHTPVAKFLG